MGRTTRKGPNGVASIIAIAVLLWLSPVVTVLFVAANLFLFRTAKTRLPKRCLVLNLAIAIAFVLVVGNDLTLRDTVALIATASLSIGVSLSAIENGYDGRQPGKG